jgi:alkyl hydroperoxide reductase subunit AhpF
VQIGLVPNTEWLKGTVELSEVRRRSWSTPAATPVCPACLRPATCTTVPYKQIIIAAGAGAKAALSAFDHLIRTHGTGLNLGEPRGAAGRWTLYAYPVSVPRHALPETPL